MCPPREVRVGDTVMFTFPHQKMVVSGRVDGTRDGHVWLNYQDGHVLVHIAQIKEVCDDHETVQRGLQPR